MIRFPESNKFLPAFLIFCLMNSLMILVAKQVLIDDDLYYNSFSEQLSYEKIDEIINSQKRWDWVIYVITPLYYLLKFFTIAVCLSVGTLLFGYRIPTWKLLQIVILSEFIFFIPALGKIIWFGFFQPDYTLNDLNSFYLFSILHFVNSTDLKPWFTYPLQLVNVFEIAYGLLLASGLRDVIKNEKYSKMVSMVGSTYGVALLLWVVVVMFLL